MTDTIDATELRNSLAQFTGTEKWYRHGMFRQLYLTDGTKYLADKAKAWWLVDAIGSHIVTNKNVRREPFQNWRFVKGEKKHRLFVTDGGKGDTPRTVASQQIDFTDFPLDDIELWAIWDDGLRGFVLMLPSEY